MTKHASTLTKKGKQKVQKPVQPKSKHWLDDLLDPSWAWRMTYR